MKTYCCTQCMSTFDIVELETDDEGNYICPHCETADYMEPFNNEDEE